MRQRDAERVAKRFVAAKYPCYKRWHFDICHEGDSAQGKSWSFGLAPDEEDDDYRPGRRFVGYVHANGVVEGLY